MKNITLQDIVHLKTQKEFKDFINTFPSIIDQLEIYIQNLFLFLHEYFSYPCYKIHKIVVDRATYRLIRCLALPHFYPETKRDSVEKGKVGYYSKVPVYVDKHLNDGILVNYYTYTIDKLKQRKIIDLLRPLQEDPVIQAGFLINNFIQEVNDKVGSIRVERSLNHPSEYLVYTKDLSSLIGKFIFDIDDAVSQISPLDRVAWSREHSKASSYLNSLQFHEKHNVKTGTFFGSSHNVEYKYFTCMMCREMHFIDQKKLILKRKD